MVHPWANSLTVKIGTEHSFHLGSQYSRAQEEKFYQHSIIRLAQGPINMISELWWIKVLVCSKEAEIFRSHFNSNHS
jgi:hypothetical protein